MGRSRSSERRKSRGNKETSGGNIKVLVVCMHSLFSFHGQVAATFLALSLSLAHESCDINVEKEFLISGVT